MTKGAVAWRQRDLQTYKVSTYGVFSSNDSYPRGLGAKVFEKVKRLGVLDTLNQYWRKWYDLGESEDRPSGSSHDPFTEPLFVEWIYLLKPVEKQVELWTCVPVCEGLIEYCKRNDYELSGTEHNYGHCVYTHLRFAVVHEDDDLDANEMQKLGDIVNDAVFNLDKQK